MNQFFNPCKFCDAGVRCRSLKFRVATKEKTEEENGLTHMTVHLTKFESMNNNVYFE